MPNIASVLKAEISRLAKKEAKALTEPLKKSNAQYRRDIAELKRQLGDVKKTVAHLDAADRARGPAQRSSSTPPRRFSASGLASHRERLGLSAADYAELVGVTAQTIYNWENGVSRPQAKQLEALSSVRTLGKREALHRLDG